MDIIKHYSAYTPARAVTGNQAGTKPPQLKCISCDEFAELAKEVSAKPVDQSQVLYNGSETRATLSDTEIAVLANKYDVRNMSDDEYDRFLDDLGSMGALSEREKQLLGQHGSVTVGFVENGKFVSSGVNGGWMAPAGGTVLFNRQDANGDIFRWINERIQWKPSYSSDSAERKAQEDYADLHKTLAGIINRMDCQQKSGAAEAEKKELVRQLADGNSDFYANMRTTMKAQVEKNKEDQEEQAIIDALAAVLDAMSGRETVAGEKTSVNKSASELTQKIGERISKLDPDDPERVKLENMLKRLQEIGIYVDMGDTDDLWQNEGESFETLTQFLIRRQTEGVSTSHPIANEVNEQA